MRRSSGDPIQFFPVIPVAMPRGEIENRGARRKFWVSLEDDGTQWLLKFPRSNTGEHWAEKVASEIGRLFQINTARVELARVDGEIATICQSFLTDDDEVYNDADSFTSHFHGSEFLDIAIDFYDPHIVRGNRDHNVKTVMDAIQTVGDANAVHRLKEILDELASYVFLDGLVGNTDRHHDNWMLKYGVASGQVWMRAAPTFDHASSLGRELTDERRERILSSSGVLNYLRRGRGGVYIDEKHRRAPSPLHLAQLLCRWNRELAEDWRNRLNSITHTDIQSVFDRIPSEFASELAKDFACQAVVASKAELSRSIK